MASRENTKEHLPLDDAHKQMRAFFFETQKSTLNKCLAPHGGCTARAIKAHSVQNGRVLELIAENGHVKGLRGIVKKDRSTGIEGPILEFADIGRNEASTFEGFCGRHDAEIFKKLDCSPFDRSNEEQLYLLAYRSISHTIHALMSSGMRSQGGYQERIRVRWDSGNEPEPAGEMALHFLMQGYELWTYREPLSEGLLRSDFQMLHHRVLTLEHKAPSFAASACFNYRLNVRQEADSYIAINVFPISETESLAILSYIPEDSKNANVLLSPILEANGNYQKYLLSKLVLAHCQNFYISPRLFNTWPTSKVNKILSFFNQTLLKDASLDNEHLFLFA